MSDTPVADLMHKFAIHAIDESKDQALNDDTKSLWATRANAYATLAVAASIRGQ